jgi:hypothetical protein
MGGVVSSGEPFLQESLHPLLCSPQGDKRRLVAEDVAFEGLDFELVTVTCFSETCFFALRRPTRCSARNVTHRSLVTRASRTMDRSAGHDLALTGQMTLFQSHSISQIHCSLVTQRQAPPRVLENG